MLHQWEQQSARMPEFGDGRPRKREVGKVIMRTVRQAWVSLLQQTGLTQSAALMTDLLRDDAAEPLVTREHMAYSL